VGSGLRSRRRSHAAGLLRAALAAVLAAGLSAVPIATVMACDCAFSELPQAVREADVAMVGTLVGAAEAAQRIDRGGPPERIWTWHVERSRDAIEGDTLDVHAWEDDGANCGVSFAMGERWLVLAHAEEGRLLTNSCARNQRLDGSDPDGEAVIASLLPAVAASEASTGGLSLPVPVIVATGVAVLMGLIGAVAFRTRRADPVS
jgi:hypothetical protein